MPTRGRASAGVTCCCTSWPMCSAGISSRSSSRALPAPRIGSTRSRGSPPDASSSSASAPATITSCALAPRAATPTPSSPSIDTMPEQRAPVMKPTSRARPAPASIGSDTLKGCSKQTKHRSSSTSRENDDLTIQLSVGGCTIRLTATGKFTFNEDYTDIALVAPGARVVIEVDYGAHDYRLTVRPGTERTFKVDDEARPFDAEAKA